MSSSRTVYSLVCMTSIAIGLLFTIAGLIANDLHDIIIGLSFLPLAAACILGFEEGVPISVNPAVILLINIMFGVTFRSFYILYSSNSRVATMLSPYSLSTLVPGALAIFVFVAIFGIVFLFCKFRIPIEKLEVFSNREIQLKRLVLVNLLAVSVAGAGLYMLAKQFGIDFNNLSSSLSVASEWSQVAEGIASVSQKRTGYVSDESGKKIVAAFGHIRSLEVIPRVLFLFVVSGLILKRKIFSGTLLSVPLVLSSLCFATILSSRMTFISAMLACFIIVAARKGFSLKISLPISLAAILVIFVLGEARDVSSGKKTTQQQDNFVDHILGSGNFIPIARTGIIIENVPDKMKFMYGASYLKAFIGFIPRVLWPGKPDTAIGREVKEKIMLKGYSFGGNPPGAIGEAFINFGYVGVFIIPILFGLIFATIYRSLLPLLKSNDLALVLYAIFFTEAGFRLFAVSFAQGVTDLLVITVIAVAIYLGITVQKQKLPE